MNRNAIAWEARVEFATMFNKALVDGQTPKGKGPKWTNNGFADRLDELDPKDPPYSEANVRGWRNVTKPGNPDRLVIVTILNALYDDNPDLAPERAKLHRLWKRANGDIDPDDLYLDRDTGNIGHWTDDLARFSARAEPRRDPSGRAICELHSEIGIFVTDPVTVDVDGKPRSVKVGVIRAALRIASDTHEFVEDTLAGSGTRGNDNLEPRASGFRIVGPRDAEGRINGVPQSGHLVSLRRYKAGPPVARIVLETDRGAFDVTDGDTNEAITDANRIAVLNALMAAKFETAATTLTLKNRMLDLPGESA